MTLSREFLKKYNVSGPRYTSYPTSPHWTRPPTEDQWLNRLGETFDQSDKEGRAASLYLHIPFCEALCTYCGCNTRITRNHRVGAAYIRTVLKEWDLYLSRLQRNLTLGEIYLGGGTPTFLNASELKMLLEGILSRVRVSDSRSFTVEADPRVTHPEQLELLASMGFKQLTLGIQDFDPVVQKIVNRVQSEDRVREITLQARDLGFTSINYDLIYGLPLQTPRSVEGTFDALSRLRPDRVAFYSYVHAPWIKSDLRKFTEDDLPSPDEKQFLYELGRQRLQSLGYFEIGMEQFVLETDSLWQGAQDKTLFRNFMGYRVGRTAPLIGLGVSAMGDAWTALIQNEKLLELYQSRVESGELPIHRGHLLSSQDLMLREHISNLINHMGTPIESEYFKNSSGELVHSKLKELEENGLVLLSQGICQVTDLGKPFLKNICRAFDPHIR